MSTTRFMGSTLRKVIAGRNSSVQRPTTSSSISDQVELDLRLRRDTALLTEEVPTDSLSLPPSPERPPTSMVTQWNWLNTEQLVSPPPSLDSGMPSTVQISSTTGTISSSLRIMLCTSSWAVRLREDWTSMSKSRRFKSMLQPIYSLCLCLRGRLLRRPF